MDTTRRNFITALSMLTAGNALSAPAGLLRQILGNVRTVLVGTGIRGTTFWGERIVREYPDIIEFVGLCDINEGRLKFARDRMKVKCPVFTDFDKMLDETRPDLLIVTTKDSTHHEFIIKGLNRGIDVITEKPLTTDETRCQAILEAERNSSAKLIVGFNYRWGTYSTKIRELLMSGETGRLTSVDFHWYLNTYHGASYFRRWHGQRESSGTLLVHKATHHFDLLNWWIDSDPEEVFAFGSLDHYGSNSGFRGKNCRSCDHQRDCAFYWDISTDKFLTDLYVKNEKYDGYIRDNCLFRHEINIYDKMSVQIRYVNGVVVNYSLTTYSPFEGWRAAFNGINGRIEAWQDIPWLNNQSIAQSELHAAEIDQGKGDEVTAEPVVLHKNWQDLQIVNARVTRGGHGGGDARLQDRIFRDSNDPDPYRHMAGVRDGAMSILIGIAARKSIESGRVVRIAELTDLQPRAKRL